MVENEREQTYKQHEEERDRIFKENKDRRDREAAERRDEIWRDMEEGLRLPDVREVQVEPPVEKEQVKGEEAPPGCSTIFSTRFYLRYYRINTRSWPSVSTPLTISGPHPVSTPII
jgi:hypothetical protein